MLTTALSRSSFCLSAFQKPPRDQGRPHSCRYPACRCQQSDPDFGEILVQAKSWHAWGRGHGQGGYQSLESLYAPEPRGRSRLFRFRGLKVDSGKPSPGIPDPPPVPVVFQSLSQYCLSSHEDSPEGGKSLYRYVDLTALCLKLKLNECLLCVFGS